MKFEMEDILKQLQEGLIDRLDEMKDKESTFLVFREEFLKFYIISDKMVKKIFDSAYKLVNEDFKALIGILIGLIDFLSMFMISNEALGTGTPSKLKIAVDLLKESASDNNGRYKGHEIEKFVGYFIEDERDFLETLLDLIEKRRAQLSDLGQ